MTWEAGTDGVLALPSGRLVRGRGLRHPLPTGAEPSLGVYLLARSSGPMPWEAHWVRWRDFRVPADPRALRTVLLAAWERAPAERVEVACRGGRGRTGTALACLAVLDGVPPGDAVGYVRQHYSRHAVETPAQRAFVAAFLPR
jgi:protein-tyrosine phosphatase